MKKNVLLFCFCLLSVASLQAQVVTEEVHFDSYQSATNNDFVNYFNNGNGLIQISTNGITGGCVVAPDSINWGNDNAVYCSHFHHNIGDTIQTSICFKYNPSTIHPISFQRAVSLWLVPSADFNHYIIGTINYNQKMELITYGWSNNGGPVATLVANHWYRYELRAVMIGGLNNQVDINASIYDLGFFGTTAPTFINSSGGTINDNILLSDTSIQVSFSGTTYGGAALLDDFQFHGRKGVSVCPAPAAVNDLQATYPILIYQTPDGDFLNIILDNNSGDRFTNAVLYNAAGAIVVNAKLNESRTLLNISRLTSGLYILRCSGVNNVFSRKILVID